MKFLLQLTLALLTISNAIFAEVPRVKIGIKKRIDDCKRRTKHGDILFVHYTGSLEDRTVFDTSLPNGPPYRFTLGYNQVMKGWDDGLTRMCVGEKRRLIIPPELAYGKEGSGSLIPPNAVLYFEMELVKLLDRIEL